MFCHEVFVKKWALFFALYSVSQLSFQNCAEIQSGESQGHAETTLNEAFMFFFVSEGHFREQNVPYYPNTSLTHHVYISRKFFIIIMP